MRPYERISSDADSFFLFRMTAEEAAAEKEAQRVEVRRRAKIIIDALIRETIRMVIAKAIQQPGAALSLSAGDIAALQAALLDARTKESRDLRAELYPELVDTASLHE